MSSIPEEAWRYRPRTSIIPDDDDDKANAVSEEMVYECRGVIEKHNRQIDLPTTHRLLILTASPMNEDGQSLPLESSRSIRLNDKEYHLVALVFSNKTHFTGAVLVDSFTLYYDGLCKPKMRLCKLNEAIPRGYFVCQLCYAPTQPKPNSNNNGEDQIEAHDTEVAEVLNLLSKTTSERRSMLKRMRTKTPSKTSPSNNTGVSKKQRKRYPLGFTYLKSGSERGRRPLCHGCKQEIEREESRIIHQHIYDKQRGWSRTIFVHANKKCTASGYTTEQMERFRQSTQAGCLSDESDDTS